MEHGPCSMTSITKFKMLGGYPRINSKNMHHVNVVNHVPNQSLHLISTYRRLTHIVLPLLLAHD